MCRACTVPRSPSHCLESLQVDARACHGCAHPSAQGQGLVAGPSPPLAMASLGAVAVWCRRRTPRPSFLGVGLRAEQCCFLQGFVHAVSTGPSAPQHIPELRFTPRHRARGGRPSGTAACSLCVDAEVCCERLLCSYPPSLHSGQPNSSPWFNLAISTVRLVGVGARRASRSRAACLHDLGH
jgi:hypothetical protein